MDNIIEGVCKKNITNPEHIKKIQNEIKRNYNFHYEDNFKKMLAQVIGLSSIEKIEKQATQQKLFTLKATLTVTGSFKPSGLFPPALQK